MMIWQARLLIVPVVAGLLLASAPELAADTGFRCNSRLVSLGDRKHEVKNKCGDPESVNQRLEKRTIRQKVRRWVNGFMHESTEEREVEVTIDEWVYDLGPERFLRYVSFENNRVTLITSGDRGTRD